MKTSDKVHTEQKQFGMEKKTIHDINGIISRYPEVEKVVIYGSRAKGNYKEGSDIDLVFFGDQLNLEILNAIDNEIDDLLLPYTFDLSIYGYINNPDLKEHINRAGKNFYIRVQNSK